VLKTAHECSIFGDTVPLKTTEMLRFLTWIKNVKKESHLKLSDSFGNKKLQAMLLLRLLAHADD
jgi:hypothetical protein